MEKQLNLSLWEYWMQLPV